MLRSNRTLPRRHQEGNDISDGRRSWRLSDSVTISVTTVSCRHWQSQCQMCVLIQFTTNRITMKSINQSVRDCLCSRATSRLIVCIRNAFEQYHPQPPMASSSPILGFATPTQNSNHYYLRNGWATDFKFGRHIHMIHLTQSPLKILEKRQRGRCQGLPNVLSTPLLSQKRV